MLFADGTENVQEPRRGWIVPSWILESTPEADWFHVAGQDENLFVQLLSFPLVPFLA